MSMRLELVESHSVFHVVYHPTVTLIFIHSTLRPSRASFIDYSIIAPRTATTLQSHPVQSYHNRPLSSPALPSRATQLLFVHCIALLDRLPPHSCHHATPFLPLSFPLQDLVTRSRLQSLKCHSSLYRPTLITPHPPLASSLPPLLRCVITFRSHLGLCGVVSLLVSGIVSNQYHNALPSSRLSTWRSCFHFTLCTLLTRHIDSVCCIDVYQGLHPSLFTDM